ERKSKTPNQQRTNTGKESPITKPTKKGKKVQIIKLSEEQTQEGIKVQIMKNKYKKRKKKQQERKAIITTAKSKSPFAVKHSTKRKEKLKNEKQQESYFSLQPSPNHYSWRSITQKRKESPKYQISEEQTQKGKSNHQTQRRKKRKSKSPNPRRTNLQKKGKLVERIEKWKQQERKAIITTAKSTISEQTQEEKLPLLVKNKSTKERKLVERIEKWKTTRKLLITTAKSKSLFPVKYNTKKEKKSKTPNQ
ncbi:8609_t:CDS:2, partial [Scutellospora calospora]